LGGWWADPQLHTSNDCLIGTQKLMHSDIEEPINIGSDEMVTINQLVDIVEEIAGVKLKRNYKLDAPKGVRGCNSDNTLIEAKLAWAPSTSLRAGMERAYRWIYDQAKAREGGAPISLRRRDEVLPEHEPPLEDWHRNGLSLPLAEALPIIGATRLNAGAKSFPQV
jgi:hypothetical protein